MSRCDIRFQFPKNHCALLINKSSARLKYEVNVQLGLIDIGYHNYVAAVIQNMTEKSSSPDPFKPGLGFTTLGQTDGQTE